MLGMIAYRRRKMVLSSLIFAFGLVNFVHGGLSFYGNEIRRRSTAIEAAGAKTFIDIEVIPGYGKLKEFLIFNHDSTLPLTLQIWTMVDIYNFKLKWQKTVEFNEGTNKNYTFVIDEDVDITANERIGFSTDKSEQNIPVSFDYVEDPIPSMFHRIDTTLEVGTMYRFNANKYPALFSMGIRLETLSGDPSYYGNEMKLPSSQQTTGGKRIWIDKSITLEAGTLQSYHIFVKKVHDPNVVRLQIWSQKDPTSPVHQLTWEKRVELSQGEDRQYDFVLTPSEQFQVDSTSYIGWTCENDLGPIGYSFDGSHKTIKSDPIDEENYPKVGEDMSFDETSLPYAFTVGVKIGPPRVDNTADETTSGATSLFQSGENTKTTRGITSSPKPKPKPKSSHSTQHGLAVLCLVLVLMNIMEFCCGFASI